MRDDRLYQDKVWTDAQGVEHKIKKMEPGHVKNVIAMLRRHVTQLAFAESMHLLAGADVMNGEMAIDHLENEAARVQDDPERWLENTPLMKELVRVDLRNERRLAKRTGSTHGRFLVMTLDEIQESVEKNVDLQLRIKGNVDLGVPTEWDGR